MTTFAAIQSLVAEGKSETLEFKSSLAGLSAEERLSRCDL